MTRVITPKKNKQGTFVVSPDKSISHRALLFSSLADGKSIIENISNCDDCMSTISCLRELGVKIELSHNASVVHGVSLNGFTPTTKSLNVGNSGTTLRLLSGILSAQNFSSTLTGDASICTRPMSRIIAPLRKMGADIKGVNDNLAPLQINGKKLTATSYEMPVASAQVKSAILLASLYADGMTEIIEPVPTRNHSEIMLNHMGADIRTNGKMITSRKITRLEPQNLRVCGDTSSALYFLVAAIILKNSKVTVKDVCINKTRTGAIEILKRMGANIEYSNVQNICGETSADITATSSKLFATEISGEVIPSLIDDIPILSVAAAFAEGVTMIKDAKELRYKECDRIQAVATELTKFGVKITELPDGLTILGEPDRIFSPATINSYNDHRIAMSMSIAALCASGKSSVIDAECVSVSFPDFYNCI